MKNIVASLSEVLERISSAEQYFQRPPGSVKLLAVSKTKPIEDICSAMAAGQLDFAENYVQEAIAKITQISDPRVFWHFIGPVQSNKTRTIAEHFHWVHSIDRNKIAQRLNDMRPQHLPPLNICIQVNCSAETSKSGVCPNDLADFAQFCSTLPRIKLRGLMTLPAPCNDFEQQRIPFKQLREMLIELQSSSPDLDTLSMGTSQDMEAAIAEGATIVRIGTAIFGERPGYRG